jgi:hypothetical protein
LHSFQLFLPRVLVRFDQPQGFRPFDATPAASRPGLVRQSRCLPIGPSVAWVLSFLPEPAFNGWLREAFLLIDIAVMAELPVKSLLFGNIPALELSRPMSRQPGRYFCGLKVSAKCCGLGCDAGPRRKSGPHISRKAASIRSHGRPLIALRRRFGCDTQDRLSTH